VLVDAGSGQIFFERDSDLPLPPASTTKILTALVVLESGRPLSETLTVSKNATYVPSSKLFLRPGQMMTIRDLLYALLLSSANDASLVLAEGIGGTVERFAEMMTLKARDLGATNSRFTNPHGLTAPGHYSTARDMALIFNYALKNSTFREIVQTKSSVVASITAAGRAARVRKIVVQNHNRLLWNFDGALGGKTGYTLAAQRCFVGSAARNGAMLTVSLLGSRNLWGDTRKLLEYGLQNYETLKLAAAEGGSYLANGHAATQPESSSSSLFSAAEAQSLKSPLGYILQVGSFRDRDRAESLQKTIRAGGLQAFVESWALNSGEITYRVRVGPYPQLGQAQEAARDIENRAGHRAIIVPASPVSPPSERPS
jgi:D-alanyl-D-alanine carboxypeptidase